MTSPKGELLLGRTVEIETDAEIIAKKIVYRGSRFKARDVFDFACVIQNNCLALDAARSGRSRARR